MSKLIVPQWPLPKGVAACSSSRIGGVSLPPYDSLNLGAHCGDNPDHVEENRKRLFAAGNLPSKPVWLEQVHGKDVLKLTGEPYASMPVALSAAPVTDTLRWYALATRANSSRLRSCEDSVRSAVSILKKKYMGEPMHLLPEAINER